jgi:hypothetical protein
MKKRKEIMQVFEFFLLNAMKTEDNKGNNANAFTHSTVRGSLIINQLEIRNPTRPDPTRLEFEIFFFDRRLSPFAHLGPFSYFRFET